MSLNKNTAGDLNGGIGENILVFLGFYGEDDLVKLSGSDALRNTGLMKVNDVTMDRRIQAALAGVGIIADHMKEVDERMAVRKRSFNDDIQLSLKTSRLCILYKIRNHTS